MSLLLILSVLVVPVLPGVSSVLGGHGGRRSRDSVWLGLLCAFIADRLVLVPSFDLVRLKGGRRIRCGLWLASSLRRGGSFQSSPSVGFGFRLSVSPAAAESFAGCSCCSGCRCSFSGLHAAWRWFCVVGFCGFTCVGPLRRGQQDSTVVGGEQWPWPVVAVTGETPGSYEVLQTSRLCTFLLFFFSFQGVYVSGDCTVDHI